jgi:pimeloyl-ACP methyl ester carboxylesterase
MATGDTGGGSRRGQWQELALVAALLGFVSGCGSDDDGSEPAAVDVETAIQAADSTPPPEPASDEPASDSPPPPEPAADSTPPVELAEDSPTPVEPSPEPTPAAQPPADSLERPADALSWSPCGNLECAEVEVPIDHDEPAAGTISIAINRARASDEVPYRGVILLNPGGPGAPGKPFAASAANVLRRLFPGFDIVGFDPRGVGESAALGCTFDIDPGRLYTESGVEGLFAGLEATSERCAEEDGLLFQHLSSRAVVADLDRIREALGHEQINFYGISYGTHLGALYAMTFPEHARAVVLDSAAPASSEMIEIINGQFEALLDAHAAFLDDCATGALDCGADTEAAFASRLASATERGQRAAFVSGWASLLTSPPGRDRLAQVLREEAEATQGPAMQAPEDTSDSGDRADAVSAAANLATSCSDNTAAPLSVSEAEALMDSFEQRSPDFATQGVGALNCSGWKVESDPAPEIAFTPRVPLLVIGGTQDSLTPLQWAQDIAAAMPGSSLLVSEHYGHGAIGYGGPCILPYLHEYMENLTPVPVGTRCAGP